MFIVSSITISLGHAYLVLIGKEFKSVDYFVLRSHLFAFYFYCEFTDPIGKGLNMKFYNAGDLSYVTKHSSNFIDKR